MLHISTKANTLQRLQPLVQKAIVLPQVCFTVEQYQKDIEEIWQSIAYAFGTQSVIVRSSALNEDTEKESMAGKYLSVADCTGKEEILSAITQVIDAFGDDNKQNQVFVQPMVQNVQRSGVIFTMEPSLGSHYYVMNYDEQTGATDSVTGGIGRSLQLYYQFKGSDIRNEKLAPIIDLARELEQLLGQEALDIEFAQDKQGGLYLLQVRPLVLKVPVVNFKKQQDLLFHIHQKISQENGQKPYLLGQRNLYGVMPDWNPAEMIGIRPKELAMSLYKKLITDGTWAYQRDNYGYRNLRSFPLMLDFGGLPYIDVRVSFNSFIPRNLPAPLGEKLVSYYLERLAKAPEMHDKVEFAIIYSCFTFDFDQRINILKDYGFSNTELDTLKKSLLALTNQIINSQDGLWIKDAQKIDVLKKRHQEIMNSALDKVSKVYWLLEDCARYGTLPFAGLARAGFIAVQLLQSLVAVGILSWQDYHAYMNGLETVSSWLAFDKEHLAKEAFLQKYGHLRPGTYDITSYRYDMAPELYFGTEEAVHGENGIKDKKPQFKLSLEQYAAIQEKMTDCGLQGNVLSLFEFIKAAIEGREYAKFVFTKSLSDALELLAEIGQEYGYQREEMAYTDIAILDKLYATTEEIGNLLGESIQRGKEKYQAALALIMPPLIVEADNVYAFHMPDGEPNYITDGVITAEICAERWTERDLTGKIVFIEAADPGWDWLFSRKIGGLVTAYGGANSHMAIRAGELQIPSVIGVGEKQFRILKEAKILRIDCGAHRMEVLR